MQSRTEHDQALYDFWEASSLDRMRVAGFASRLLSYEDQAPAVHPFTAAGAPMALRPVRDRVQRLFATRRSSREFSPHLLRHRHIERILASTGPCSPSSPTSRQGRRVVPEAGGLAAVHVHAVVRHAWGPLAGHVVRYDHTSHSATVVGDVPDDDELRALFQIEGSTMPQMLVVFAVDLGPVVAKYGPRGGRFVFQQVGHAAQNIGLRLAADRLRGYVLGGGLDREVLELVGLAHTQARYGGAVACGR